MKTVFFESLRYKFITKNDFYYGSCPDIHITTPDSQKENQLLLLSIVWRDDRLISMKVSVNYWKKKIVIVLLTLFGGEILEAWLNFLSQKLMYNQQQNKWYPQRCLLVHFEPTLYFIHSFEMPSEHLWGYHLFCCWLYHRQQNKCYPQRCQKKCS